MESALRTEQPILTWEDVQALPYPGTFVWTSPTVAPLVKTTLSFPQITGNENPSTGTPFVVVIGGGKLIDLAKLWRFEHSPNTKLIAVSTLWGSGAEASPIAVKTENGQKIAQVNQDLLPDARAVFPRFADTISDHLALWGMGDVWSHALEAFFSPLTTDELRKRIATFINERLMPQELVKNENWFELSAEACRLQSLTGVGLVHGIAHEMEPRLTSFGHARLCSTLLWPVMSLNISRSNKIIALAAEYNIDISAILKRIEQLFSNKDFTEILPTMKDAWPSILRNPLSRINCAVCRPSDLGWFLDQEFDK